MSTLDDNEPTVWTLDNYQLAASRTAHWRGDDKGELGARLHVAPYFDLSGECGEVMEKAKKLMRDKRVHALGGIVPAEDREAIAKELGDVLWSVANIAYDLDIPLNVIAHNNIVKIQDRVKRGVLFGSGDNR